MFFLLFFPELGQTQGRDHLYAGFLDKKCSGSTRFHPDPGYHPNQTTSREQIVARFVLTTSVPEFWPDIPLADLLWGSLGAIGPARETKRDSKAREDLRLRNRARARGSCGCTGGRSSLGRMGAPNVISLVRLVCAFFRMFACFRSRSLLGLVVGILVDLSVHLLLLESDILGMERQLLCVVVLTGLSDILRREANTEVSALALQPVCLICCRLSLAASLCTWVGLVQDLRTALRPEALGCRISRTCETDKAHMLDTFSSSM